MNNNEIRFRVGSAISAEVREALSELSAALENAEADAEVSGFAFNKGPERVGTLGGAKLVGGLSPARNDFCLSFSTDFETGEESCTIMWN